MDSTLIGIIIGASATVIPQIITSTLSFFKDRDALSAQSRMELAKLDRESAEKMRIEEGVRSLEKKNRERGSYSILIKILLELQSITMSNSNPENLGKISGLVSDINDSVANLLYDLPDIMSDEAFRRVQSNFIRSPSEWASPLLSILLNRLHQYDPQLNEPIEHPDPEKIVFIVHIDDLFWQEKSVEGFRVPKNYKLEKNIFDMTTSQRRILMKRFPSIFSPIDGVHVVDLFVPILRGEQVDYRIWQAKLDPGITDIDDILSSWEKEYNQRELDLAS